MTTASPSTFTSLDAFVWLGFHHDVSLDFRVKLPNDKDAAKTTLEAAGCYNLFEPAKAFEVIDGWWEYVMRFELAREGSVALYATFPWYQHQALGSTTEGFWLSRDAVPVATETCKVFADQLAVELADIGACETSYDTALRTLRAWWD